MGYGMGQEDQRAKRKARLAARYGASTNPVDPVPEEAQAVEPAAVAVVDEPAPKKKGGRPKGSKNKAR